MTAMKSLKIISILLISVMLPQWGVAAGAALVKDFRIDESFNNLPVGSLASNENWVVAAVGGGSTNSTFDVVNDPYKTGKCVKYAGNGPRALASQTVRPLVGTVVFEIDVCAESITAPVNIYLKYKKSYALTFYFAAGKIRYHDGGGYQDFDTPVTYETSKWYSLKAVISADGFGSSRADYYVNDVLVKKNGAIRDGKATILNELEVFGGDNNDAYYLDNIKLYGEYTHDYDGYERWDEIPGFSFSGFTYDDLQPKDLFIDNIYITNKESDYRYSHILYYMAHFKKLADSVTEAGPYRGYISSTAYRDLADNHPYNAHIASSIVSLSYIYTLERDWNPYYLHNGVRQRIEAAMEYWISQQSPGGAFPQYGKDQWHRSNT